MEIKDDKYSDQYHVELKIKKNYVGTTSKNRSYLKFSLRCSNDLVTSKSNLSLSLTLLPVGRIYGCVYNALINDTSK